MVVEIVEKSVEEQPELLAVVGWPVVQELGHERPPALPTRVEPDAALGGEGDPARPAVVGVAGALDQATVSESRSSKYRSSKLEMNGTARSARTVGAALASESDGRGVTKFGPLGSSGGSIAVAAWSEARPASRNTRR